MADGADFITTRAASERARALRQALIFGVLGVGLALFALLLFNAAFVILFLTLNALSDAGFELENAWLWIILNALLAAWVGVDTWRRPFPEVLRATFAGPNEIASLEFMPRPLSALVRHPIGWPEKISEAARGARDIFLSGPHIIKDALGEYLLYRKLEPHHVEQLRAFLRDLMSRGGRWAVPTPPVPTALHMAPLAMHLGLVLKAEGPEGASQPQLRLARVAERALAPAAQ
ncbi:MAG TPA: hypothetical protein VI643_04815 [Planctomycetota bacterium]|nr:hypothetical protein [Planctomycetota bacterium]